jgi:hypothetical protein
MTQSRCSTKLSLAAGLEFSPDTMAQKIFAHFLRLTSSTIRGKLGTTRWIAMHQMPAGILEWRTRHTWRTTSREYLNPATIQCMLLHVGLPCTGHPQGSRNGAPDMPHTHRHAHYLHHSIKVSDTNHHGEPFPAEHPYPCNDLMHVTTCWIAVYRTPAGIQEWRTRHASHTPSRALPLHVPFKLRSEVPTIQIDLS